MLLLLKLLLVDIIAIGSFIVLFFRILLLLLLCLKVLIDAFHLLRCRVELEGYDPCRPLGSHPVDEGDDTGHDYISRAVVKALALQPGRLVDRFQQSAHRYAHSENQ